MYKSGRCDFILLVNLLLTTLHIIHRGSIKERIHIFALFTDEPRSMRYTCEICGWVNDIHTKTEQFHILFLPMPDCTPSARDFPSKVILLCSALPTPPSSCLHIAHNTQWLSVTLLARLSPLLEWHDAVLFVCCTLHMQLKWPPSDEVTFRAEKSDHVSCSFRTEVLNNVLVLLGLGGETGGCYRQVAAIVVS